LIKKTNIEPAGFGSEELHMDLQLIVITLSVITLAKTRQGNDGITEE